MSILQNLFTFLRWMLMGGLVAAVIPANAFFFDKSPEPSSVQIKLSEMGVVADFKFEVKKHFIYSFDISFRYPEDDQVERARVRKLLGDHGVDASGKPVNPGVPTPVRLEISAVCKGGKEVVFYSLDADPVLTSWGVVILEDL